MTRRPPLLIASTFLLAAGLISCGGTPTLTGPAAQQEAAGSALGAGGGGDAPASTETSRTPGGGRPGAPGPDPGAGGAGGGGGRPGGPFDVEAFENRGELLAEFRPFAQDHCGGGRCVLVEKTSEAADAQEGCEIADFAYAPPAQPPGAPPAQQFIQRGTTVTVYVHCPPAAGGSPADGSSAGPPTEEGTSPSSSSESSGSSGTSSSSSDGSGG